MCTFEINCLLSKCIHDFVVELEFALRVASELSAI